MHLSFPLSRIEGRASLRVEVEGKIVRAVELRVEESSRLFEQWLVGKACEDVPSLVQRVCGVCGFAHLIAALKALESIAGLTLPEPVVVLRKLALIAGTCWSHITHLYFMVLPDCLGYESIFDVLKERKEGKLGLRMQELAARALTRLLGGNVHGMRARVGGFYKLPTQRELQQLQKEFLQLQRMSKQALEFFSNLHFLDFEREVPQLALCNHQNYTLYEGKVLSSTGVEFETTHYSEYLKEFSKAYTNAKHCLFQGKVFAVGALARMQLNQKYASNELVKELAKKLNFNSPFSNNLAQALEVLELTTQALEMLEELKLGQQLRPAGLEGGESVASLEAPRGTLYHHYKVRSGKIERANIITPTAQNLECIEADIRTFLPKLLDLPEAQFKLKLEQLIRSYDPCISCSTHFLELKLSKIA